MTLFEGHEMTFLEGDDYIFRISRVKSETGNRRYQQEVFAPPSQKPVLKSMHIVHLLSPLYVSGCHKKPSRGCKEFFMHPLICTPQSYKTDMVSNPLS